MSTLEPGEVNKVRGMFGKPAVKRPAQPRQTVRKTEAAGAEGKPEPPKMEKPAPDRAKVEVKKEAPKPGARTGEETRGAKSGETAANGGETTDRNSRRCCVPSGKNRE